MAFDDGTRFQTGYWAPEFAIPYQALAGAGYSIDVSSPGGVPPTVDPRSLGSGPDAQSVQSCLETVPGLRQPLPLEGISDAETREYCAVVLPGGYAPMVDLAFSDAMASVLRCALDRGLVIAAICHAPAALLSTWNPGEPWPFLGFRMVSFTNAEERAWNGENRLSWQVEDRLRDAGGVFVHGGVWESKVVTDRNLVTGQNSPSSQDFTRAVLEAVTAFESGLGSEVESEEEANGET